MVLLQKCGSAIFFFVPIGPDLGLAAPSVDRGDRRCAVALQEGTFGHELAEIFYLLREAHDVKAVAIQVFLKGLVNAIPFHRVRQKNGGAVVSEAEYSVWHFTEERTIQFNTLLDFFEVLLLIGTHEHLE